MYYDLLGKPEINKTIKESINTLGKNKQLITLVFDHFSK